MLSFSIFVSDSILKELCLLTDKLIVAKRIQCEAHLLNLESFHLLCMICLTLFIRFISKSSYHLCLDVCKMDLFLDCKYNCFWKVTEPFFFSFDLGCKQGVFVANVIPGDL